jgi:glycosyltransferase involved in cell wall biosynthesis
MPDPLIFPGRLALQQRVLPAYRAPLFDLLAQSCAGGLDLFAGLARPEEIIPDGAAKLQHARYTAARNLHLLRGPLYLCHQRGLIRWLEGCNPDALIVEANPRYLATADAVRWMHRRGRPVIGWGLGAPLLSGPAAGLRYKRRIQFLGRFDALVAYSRRGAEEYAALGFPAKMVFTAPNAVAPRPVAPPPARPADFTGRPCVLFVGRLQARKRIDMLLRACAALPAAIQPRLLIVGDGPARAEFEALAREIYPAAEFPGAKHGAELAPYFAAADLFALPGTGGLAVQEAMTHGLPVIVAQGDGTQDDLVRPVNGWQVKPDDQPMLDETLREALSDLTRLRRMGAESYRIVAEEINLEKMVETFVRALDFLRQR